MRAPHRLLPYNSSKGESNVWQRVWIAKRKLKNRRRKKPSVWIGPWQEGRRRPSSIFSAATFDLVRCCLVWPFVVRRLDRKSTRLNSSHTVISYAVFCLKKKNNR